MPTPTVPRDPRQLYDHVLGAAYRQAARSVAWDEAFEVAHDVASEVVRRATGTANGDEAIQSVSAWVHRAVRSRLADRRRSASRRAAAEGIHQEERANSPSGWAEPALALDARELEAVVEEALAAMPDAMLTVFLMVRREQLSYHDTAARLGIGVGTVHTQLSRANTRLRAAVATYRANTDRQTGEPARTPIITKRKS